MSVNIQVNSPDVAYTDSHITAKYLYQTTTVQQEGNDITVICLLLLLLLFILFVNNNNYIIVSKFIPVSLLKTGESLHHRHDLPHGEESAKAGGDAGGLGGQQWNNGDSGRAG